MATHRDRPALLADTLRRGLHRLHLRSGDPSVSPDVRRAMLGHLVERQFTAIYSSLAAVMLILLVALVSAHTWEIAAISALRCASLAVNHRQTRRLAERLARNEPYETELNRLNLDIAIASAIWGAFLLPLEIRDSVSPADLLLVIIILVALCLQSITTAFNRATMQAVMFGSSVLICLKLVLEITEIGLTLALGYAVLLAILATYGRLIERQTRLIVTLQIRNRQTSGRLASLNATLEETLDQLSWIASHDPLTNLRNRRAFELAIQRGEGCIEGIPRYVALLDVDHFKQINDSRGHSFGDQVLQTLGLWLTQWEAESVGRISARWGGEEFIVSFFSESRERTERIIANLNQTCPDLVVAEQDPDFAVTVSIGYAELSSPQDIAMAVKLADEALYRAKNSGRNCWKMAA